MLGMLGGVGRVPGDGILTRFTPLPASALVDNRNNLAVPHQCNPG